MNKFYFKPITQSDESQRIVNRSGSFSKKTFSAFLFIFLLLGSWENVLCQVLNTYSSGASSWTCPAGVTQITVRVWGAGGGGGSSAGTTTNGGTGGGGGAFSQSVLSVTPGTVYYYSVGSGGAATSTSALAGIGGDSWFNTVNSAPTSTAGVLAKGGGRGVNNSTTAPANGGAAASGYGQIKFSGGTGFQATANRGGAGGAGAGFSANGTAATGTAAVPGYDMGGNGGTSTTAAPSASGAAPGGGGGGSDDVINFASGAGGAGRVVIIKSNPIIADDFNSDNSFAFVNGAQTNRWTYGAGAGNPANAIYISNTSGSTNAYDNAATSVVQAYRDIVIPSSSTVSRLSFNWRATGESCCDYLRVWLVPSSFTPTAGTQITAGSGNIQVGGNFNVQSSYQTYTNTSLDISSFANTTMRLVFEWRNDNSVGSLPASIDNVSFVLPAAAPQAVGNINFGPVATANGTALRADANITAATCWTGCVGGGHEAWRGRLFNNGPGTTAWASGDNVVGSNYLQFDLGSAQRVSGVSTQSRGIDCCSEQRVTSYTVEHSLNGTTWTAIAGTFTGNTVSATVVTNTFTPVSARYVRIIPQGYNSHMSMRADIITTPCNGSTASLSAEITTNATTVRWYDSPTGGTLLGTGQYYTTGALSSNQTLYAEAYNATYDVASLTRTAVTAAVYTPTATNTSAQIVCNGTTIALSGNTPSSGSGAWTVASGPSTSSAQFANVSSPTSNFTPSGGFGNYTVRWTVTDAGCSVSADALIQWTTNPSPNPITGTTTLCVGETTTLGGNTPSYTVQSFTTVGSTTFTPTATGTAEVLVVAGGGGGGFGRGGGGGGGGVIYNSSYSVTALTPISVTVGAGGTGAANNTSTGTGGNSTFGVITATGGGIGGSHNPGSASFNNGTAGGSGGGAAINYSSSSLWSGGAASPSGQGFAGGTSGPAATDNPRNTGGGGGAGGAGVSSGSSTSNPPNGGVGLSYSITGSAVFYGGGGGGANGNASGETFTTAGAGTGGNGGGGNGAAQGGNPTNGAANTGGGGGGGGSGGSSTSIGGNGGSGIVIVKYQNSAWSWSSSNPSVATIHPSTGVVTAVSAGTTTITYTAGELGCSGSVTTTVTVKTTPTASASSNTPVCQGSTLNLTGTTNIGTSFSWSGPNGFTSTSQNPSISSPTGAASGTYTFTATFDGCSANGTTSVVITPSPTNVNAGSDISICSGGSAALIGSATGAIGATYSLTTSGGSYAVEKWVNITTGINGTGTVVWAQGNGTIGNGSGLLTNQSINLASYGGQTLYLNTYDQYDDTWDGSLYALSLNGTTVINNGGITPSDGTDTDATNGWDASAAEFETSESFVVQFETPTYSWSPATFLSATNVANPTASNVTSSTTYTMTATSNGCSVTDQVVVSLRSIPAATATNSGPVCAGTAVNLTASALAPSGQGVTMTNNATDAITGTSFTSTLNNHTVEFWVNPSKTVVLHSQVNTGISGNLAAPTTEYSFVTTPNQSGGVVGIGVSVGTNGIEVVQHGPGHFPVTLSYSGTITGWNHIAVVHISDVPYLYVNGNLVKVGLSSLYSTFPSSSTSMAYGYFGGTLDNLRVWSVSRTASQIVTDMNREVPSVATGLLQNLPLNGNGTALTGSNATIAGSSYTTPTYYTYTWAGTSAPVAGTAETQATSALAAGGNYTVTATSAGCSGTASSATTVSITNPTVTTTRNANDFVWTGATSTAWNTTSNWLQWNGSVYSFPAGFPNANTANVILPTDNANGGVCVPNEARIGAYTIAINNLTSETSHAFQLNNANARLNVSGAITLGGTWSTPTAGSIVDYVASGNQNILATTYSNLQTSGSGIKTLTGTTTVNLVLTVGASTTLNLSNRTLRLANITTVPIVNNGTWTHATSTVDFRGSGNQTIPALTYNNLQTTTSGIKTLAGTTTATGVVTVGASTTLDLGANTLNLAFVGTPLVTTGSLTIGTSTINYSGTGAQAVSGLAYHNLGTTGTGAKTLAGASSVANTLALTDGVLTLGANTFTMNGSTITRTSGSIDASNASATLAFGNASLLTLPASVFSAAVNNLTLTGTRVKATSDFSVNGILNLGATNPDATNGLLDLVQSYGNYSTVHSVNSTDSYNDLSSVILTLGSAATVTGDADITGKVRRTSITDGVTYAFGNKNMQMTFDLNGGATLPSQITIVATKGAQGLHVDKDGTSDYTPGSADTLIGGAAVKRLVQILKTGGSSEVRFDVRFPYDDSELNGNVEADLVTWDHHLPYGGRTPHEHGKTNVDATNNWVELSGHGIGYLATEGDASFTKYWMLAENIIKVQTWLGAAGGSATGDWYTASNWSKGVIPTVESILIPSATSTPHDPDPTKLPASISLATIEIQPGGVLDGGSSEITLSGGPLVNGGRGTWLNNGTFTPGTSKVIFDYTDATIAGTTTFNDITVNTGKKVTIQANSNNSIAGTIVNDGTFDATSHVNTITYSGSGQTVIQPNGTAPGYSSLKIEQQSAGTATASSQINVLDDLIIEDGTLDMATADLYVEGDFVNNSSIVNNPQVYMSGTGAQSIEGSSTTTFDILQITGTGGTATMNQDINVSSILFVEAAKTLNGGNHEIKLNGSGTPFILDGTFDAGTGTVNYTSVDPTDILPVTYYNLKSEGAVSKSLMGNTTVENTLTLDATTLDATTFALSIGNTPVSTNSGTLSVENGTLELTNGSAMSIPSSLIVNSTFKNLTLTGAGGATLNEDMIISGDLVLTAGNLNLGATMLTLETNATMSRTSGLLNTGTGGLVVKAADLDATVLSSSDINKLEINRAGGIVEMNNGNLNVTNTFTLTDGTLDINANELRLSGGITHNGGEIDADAGTVDFNNLGAYTISNGLFAGNVHGLKVTGAGGLTLSDPIKVSNALTMSGGNVTTASSSLLEIGTSTSTVGSITWNTGTVVGPLRRWFAAATNSSQASGIFPVGTIAHNRFSQINFTEAPEGGYLDIEYKDGLPPDSYSNLPLAFNENNSNRFIQNADEDGYWEMKPYNSSGTLYGALDTYKYDLLLRINNPTSVQNGGILNNPPGVRLIRAKGNPDGSHEPWSMAGTYSTAIQMVEFEDYVIKSVDVEGFSWFNGGGNNQNPLPIELLSFAGNCEGNEVTLTWATASEFNNNYFVIEKSRDGVNWNTIHTKQGSGTSFQKLNYVYVEENQTEMESYYRLSQVDIDGKNEVFDPIFVGCSNETSIFKTYPNPSDDSFQILVNNESLVGKATINILDTKGTVVSMKEVQVEEGTNLFYLNESMAPGIYYISISNGIDSTEVVKHSVR